MHSFLRFNRGLLAMPVPLQLWVGLLIAANLITPLFFFEHVEARVTLAVGLFGMALMTALTERFGFSRILGVGHVGWLPLLAFLAASLPEVSATSGFGLWLRAVVVLDAVSLVLDGVDAVRWLRGDRAETVPNLEPPLAAPGSPS